MYHRVTHRSVDPWQLSVEPKKFDEHLNIMKQFGTVLSSGTLIEHLHRRKLKNRSLVITFDDGYKDNFQNAFPLLKKHNLPATFFITTETLGKNKSFWWDELETLLIHTPVLPTVLSLKMHGINVHFELGEETTLTVEQTEALKSWKALLYHYQSKRTELFEAVWNEMKGLKYEQQQEILHYLREWSGNSGERTNDYSMSLSELTEMALHPLITIGGHTLTHPDLSCHNENYQYNEVSGNKKELEKFIQKEVDFFAYPFGRFNDHTREVVKLSGYKAAFTTQTSFVSYKSDPFFIQRVQVNNWSADEFRGILNAYFLINKK